MELGCSPVAKLWFLYCIQYFDVGLERSLLVIKYHLFTYRFCPEVVGYWESMRNMGKCNSSFIDVFCLKNGFLGAFGSISCVLGN